VRPRPQTLYGSAHRMMISAAMAMTMRLPTTTVPGHEPSSTCRPPPSECSVAATGTPLVGSNGAVLGWASQESLVPCSV
jgi:hypothetical protein